MENLSEAIYFMKDFLFFKEIQLNKYKSGKRQNLMPGTPEWDVVVDIIQEYWCDLLATGYLNNKNINEKKKIFDSVTIIFPYTQIPTQWMDGIDYVDFASF